MSAFSFKNIDDPAAGPGSAEFILAVPSRELAAALNAVVGRRLPTVLSVLAALAFTFAVHHHLVWRESLSSPLTSAALLGAGLLITLRLAGYYVSVPSHWSQPLSAFALALVAQYGLIRLEFSREPAQTLFLLPIMLAPGFIFLSWLWSLMLVFGISAGWLFCAVESGLGDNWWNAGAQLAAAGVLSLVVHGSRLATARKLESLRLQTGKLHDQTSEAIKAATQSQERLERLCAATFEGIVIHDQGRIVQANESAFRMFGLEPADLLEKSVLDLMAPESRKCVAERVLMGNFQSFGAMCLRSDNSLFPVELWAKSLPCDGRKLSVLALRDITERRKTEDLLAQERNRLEAQIERQAALAQLELAIGETIELNQVLAKIAEITAHSLPATAGAAVIAWREKEGVFFASSGNLAAMGAPRQFQQQLIEAKATQWILNHRESLFVAEARLEVERAVSLSPAIAVAAFAGVPLINRGEVLGILFALETEPRGYRAEDRAFLQSLASRAAVATRKVQLYQELRTANAELESQKGQLQRQNSELAEANRAGEAANRAKSEFLATMSHELRTPLNGILGLTEVLAHSDLSANQHENLQSVRASGEQLLALIDKVLNYTRLESGGVSTKKRIINVRGLTHEALSASALEAEAKGLKLNMDISEDVPEQLMGELDWLRDTLAHLVDNAVKFTSQGQVSVHAWIKERSGNRYFLQFEVRDTGIGIAADSIALLFKPFAQSDSTHSRVHGGAGLGLALCQRMVSLMGGEIGVHSAPGVGSTFWFTMEAESTLAATPV